MKRNYKRVHFLLERELYTRFDNISNKTGISKAKLLKRWLKDSELAPNKQEDQSSYKKIMSFNFRIDPDLFDEVTSKSIRLGITFSDFVRLIIDHKTRNITSVHLPIRSFLSITPIKELWSEGKLKEITQSENIEMLSDNELLILCWAHIELGQLNKARDIINLLESKKVNEVDIQIWLYLAKGDIYRYEMDLIMSQHFIDKAKSIAFLTNNKNIWATIYEQIGDIYAIQEKIYLAIESYENAVEYIDSSTDELKVCKIYMKLSNMYIFEMHQDQSDHYQHMALNLVNKSKNKYLVSWYCDMCAYNSIANGFSSESRLYIEENIKRNVDIGSYKELFSNYRNLGRINLVDGKNDDAYRLFICAERFEKRLRPNLANHRIILFKKFIEAKNDFPNSISALQKLNDNQKMILPNLTKYIISSAKYIYGRSSDDIEEGLSDLRYMGNNGKYELVRSISNLTLNNKKVIPFGFKL